MFLRKKSQGVQWLVVFLGNPGPKYDGTRHNVGFTVAGIVARAQNININRLRFSALTAACSLNDERVLLLKPQTYMNLSGNAVAPAAAYYKIPPERVVAVCDDIALPPGKLRIRAKGSSGGHNGLKSIISALGTEEFPRIKIGVGSPAAVSNDYEVADWVLGKLSGKDGEAVERACQAAAEALQSIISDGVERAMSKYISSE